MGSAIGFILFVLVIVLIVALTGTIKISEMMMKFVWFLVIILVIAAVMLDFLRCNSKNPRPIMGGC